MNSQDHHNAPGERLLHTLERAVSSSTTASLPESDSRSQHPSAGQLYAYASGGLTGEEAERVCRHVRSCSSCNRKTLYAMRMLDDVEMPGSLKDDLAAYIEDWRRKLCGALDSITWATSLWQPQHAGMPVYAAEIPEQTQMFSGPGKEGDIEITCAWRDQFGTTPAYLQISWLANLNVERELWALFFDPDSKELLAEIPLGKYLEGGKNITARTLGFNPSRQKWAVSLLLKEH